MSVIYQFANLAVNVEMDIYEIRLQNLRSLATDPSIGRAKLLDTVPDLSPSYLSQMMGKTPTKPIGSRIARKIEAAIELPSGWMDREWDNKTDNAVEHRMRRIAETEFDGVLQKLGIEKSDPLFKDGKVRDVAVNAFVRYQKAHGKLTDDVATELVRLALELRS